MPTYNKNYYKGFIAKGRKGELIENLLEDLSSYLVNYDDDVSVQKIYDALIIQSGRWQSLKQTRTIGIAHEKDNTITETQISNDVLTNVNNIPQYFFDFMNGDKSEKKSPVTDMGDQIEEEVERKKEVKERRVLFSKQYGVKIGAGVFALLLLVLVIKMYDSPEPKIDDQECITVKNKIIKYINDVENKYGNKVNDTEEIIYDACMNDLNLLSNYNCESIHKKMSTIQNKLEIIKGKLE